MAAPTIAKRSSETTAAPIEYMTVVSKLIFDFVQDRNDQPAIQSKITETANGKLPNKIRSF